MIHNLIIFNKSDFYEWYNIVSPILNHYEFQKRKNFNHHGHKSVYDHCLVVSIKAYSFAKKFNLDFRSAAIAGILHDFYSKPWMDDIEKKPLFKRHAFTHAEDALNNARKYFSDYLNPSIENAILRHMFPLNIVPPICKVGYVVTIVDKVASIDFFTKECLFKTFGIVKRS